MKINFGANKNFIEGYTNLDINPNNPKITKTDMVNLDAINIADDSVEEILAPFVLEYIPFPYIKLAIETWFRKLKSQGQLVITSYDIQMLSHALTYSQLPMDSVNQILYPVESQPKAAIYSYPLIEKLSKMAGFNVDSANVFPDATFIIRLEKP